MSSQSRGRRILRESLEKSQSMRNMAGESSQFGNNINKAAQIEQGNSELSHMNDHTYSSPTKVYPMQCSGIKRSASELTENHIIEDSNLSTNNIPTKGVSTAVSRYKDSDTVAEVILTSDDGTDIFFSEISNIADENGINLCQTVAERSKEIDELNSQEPFKDVTNVPATSVMNEANSEESHTSFMEGSSSIVQIVNSTELSHVQSVTIRYLVKGHTHMSADGVHGNIESKMRSKRNIYDFEDLLEIVRESRKQTIVKEQKIEHFRHWKSLKAVTKKVSIKLADIQEVSFQRGSASMYVKLNLNEEAKQVGFLQKKVVLGQLPERKSVPRGINKKKKNEIIKVLCSKMNDDKKLFWSQLPESDQSEDLLKNHGSGGT